MSLKASCFAVKQQFYGHFLATRIFHLETEKENSVATWRSHKKVNLGPCDSLYATIYLEIGHCFTERL